MKTEKTTIQILNQDFPVTAPKQKLTALLRLKNEQWQVQWPEDNEFHNLTGWFFTKTYEQTIEKLKSFPLNAGLKYKLIT